MLNRIKALFRRLDNKNGHLDYNVIHAERASTYLDLQDRDVLIIGCNRGKDCRLFVEMGARSVHGLDVIDDVGIEYKHKKVKYFKQSAEKMDIPEESYDLVYCFATMEHIPRIDLAFREMVRVAKRGGIVYCVAAPLWHSRFGHHKKNLFEQFPWIHLRMTRDEIVELAESEGIKAQPNMAHHIDYMLNPLYFNKTPSKEYVQVCNSLEGMKILVNRLESEPKDLLTPELSAELVKKGYEPEDLLAITHTYVGQKI